MYKEAGGAIGDNKGLRLGSALYVSAPKGEESDGMHRGSQVYQIAEEIDFSVDGRITTGAWFGVPLLR